MATYYNLVTLVSLSIAIYITTACIFNYQHQRVHDDHSIILSSSHRVVSLNHIHSSADYLPRRNV